MIKAPEKTSQETPLSSLPSSQRNFNLDIIRIFAFICIPCTHFFLYTGFYDLPVDNPAMMFLMCLRNLCLTCIPLFMILTGYLQGTKDFAPDKRYYAKIFKFLIPYFIVCILTLLMNALMHKTVPSVTEVIKGFTTYTGYTWYVEMYLGIFLFIPFLNKFYNALKTKKQERILLGILIVFTLLPTVVNTYCFTSGSPFFYPAKSGETLKILPDFWTRLYPLTFYFTGAYLHRHKEEIKWSAKKAFIILSGAILVFSAYNILRNYGYNPSVYNWVGRNSLTVYVTAVLIFIFVLSLNFKKAPQKCGKFIGKISDLTFSAYICSYLVDKIFYIYLKRYTESFAQRILTYPLSVIFVIISSLIAAFFIDLFTKKACTLINKHIIKT
ncbi:MAG: acyltransferase family protein [Ruminococcus sp.]|nr:acyltransferase family protein [Ruminococcus sp.]